MNEIFAMLYSWWVSADLHDVLLEPLHGWGYTFYALLMVLIALLVCLVYYWALDRPCLARTCKWIVAGLIAGLLTFLTTLGMSVKGMNDGDFNVMTSVGEDCLVTWSDCLAFGLGNMVWCFLMFVFFSLFCRYLSVNCKRTPFRF